MYNYNPYRAGTPFFSVSSNLAETLFQLQSWQEAVEAYEARSSLLSITGANSLKV